MTFSITTLSLGLIYETSISESPALMTHSITKLNHYTECRVLFIVMLNEFTLSVVILIEIMLSVVVLNVIMVSVVMLSLCWHFTAIKPVSNCVK